MTTTWNGTLKYRSWTEEPPYDGNAPLPRLSHAQVEFTYEGDLAAASTCHYVMAYGADGAGVVRGLEYVDAPGGLLVLAHDGTFGAEGVEIRWTVLPSLSGGEYAAWQGSGGYRAIHGQKEWQWQLELGR